MHAILAMVRKDLTLLFRDRMSAFFTLVFPMVMAVFFGTIFSGGARPSEGIRIAVVDEDSTAASIVFAESLAASPDFRVTRMTRAEATEAVKLGRQTAFLVMPPGFGASQQRLFHGEPPRLEIGIDPSRRAESAMLEGLLSARMARRMQTAMSDTASMRALLHRSRADLGDDPGLPAGERASIERFLVELETFLATPAARGLAPGAARTAGDSGRGGSGGPSFEPVRFRKSEVARQRTGPRNAYEVSFPQGTIWGVLSCAFGFALGLVVERRRGTLIRIQVSPLRRHTVLLGKALGCFAGIVGICTILFGLGMTVFGVRPASPALLAMAVLCVAFGFVGIMMLISTLGKTESSVSGLGQALTMFMAMTGGGMVPLFVMPGWLQSLSVVSPVRWAILAFEGALWRGFTFEQMLLPCGILLAVGVAAFAIGVRAFRWNEA